MTRADHASGSDRIFEAVEKLDPEGRHDVVVNVQGDLPTIDPAAIAASIVPLADGDVDIATLVAIIEREEERTNPNVVKMVGSPHRARAASARSTSPARRRLTATGRSIITSASTPIAAGRCSASSACRRRRWSCARGWSSCGRSRPACASMRSLVDDVPLGVDTPHDLERAREIIAQASPKWLHFGASMPFLTAHRQRKPDHFRTCLRHRASYRLPRRARAPIPTSPAGGASRLGGCCPARPSRTPSPP